MQCVDSNHVVDVMKRKKQNVLSRARKSRKFKRNSNAVQYQSINQYAVISYFSLYFYSNAVSGDVKIGGGNDENQDCDD